MSSVVSYCNVQKIFANVAALKAVGTELGPLFGFAKAL